jgi:quercetin dioxygenase-like cupin family protein
MTEFRKTGRRLSRRAALHTGIAAAAAALAAGDLAVASADVSLQLGSKVEPQKFPWGWIRWLMSGQIDPQAEMTLGIVHVEPNQLNPMHVHPNSAEFLHMLSGTCEHLIGDRWVTLKAGDTLRIPKGVRHRARTKDQAFEAVIVYDTPTRKMVPVSDAKPS